MQDSVNKFIKDSLLAFREDLEDFKRHNWVMQPHPAQAVTVVGSIKWCEATQGNLSLTEDIEENMQAWLAENISQLEELTKLVSRSDLNPIQRGAIVALIT